MNPNENLFQEAKKLLSPIKERPDQMPSETFTRELQHRIAEKKVSKTRRLAFIPLASITSVLIILFIIVLSSPPGKNETTSQEGFIIEEKSDIHLISTFDYGDAEGQVGLFFDGMNETLPVTVSSFDMVGETLYFLDNADRQVDIVSKEGNMSFPIQTDPYVCCVLSDILVADSGAIYVLNSEDHLVYQYQEDGELVETYNFSSLEYFFPDELFELANGEIIVGSSQEKFASLETLDFITDENMVFQVERLNRKESKVTLQQDGNQKELQLSSNLGVYGRVTSILENQVILTQEIDPPVMFGGVTETHVIAMDFDGTILGGVRIPHEKFMEVPGNFNNFIVIDGNQIFLLIPEREQLALYELTLGKEYDSFIEEQVEEATIGYDYKTFGEPFPELENEINNLLKNGDLGYGDEHSLNGVAIDEKGTVIIDFKDFLAPGPASAQAKHLGDMLQSFTFDKFPEIETIYIQFDGSFSAWAYWLGSTEDPWVRTELKDAIIDIPEYNTMADWMKATTEIIHSGVPREMTKKEFEVDVASMVVKYANFYLTRTTEEHTIELLKKLKEKGLAIVGENDEMKRSERMKELYDLLVY